MRGPYSNDRLELVRVFVFTSAVFPSVLLVFLGSGLGGALRYGITVLMPRHDASTFPYATLAVNLIGCLLIGFGATLLAGREPWRLLLLVGVLGGFTTFSSYARETLDLWQAGQIAAAMAYVLISNLAGLALALAGHAMARQIVS